ncbi:MAG: pyridoxal phosphate-dependent aminotransferase [Christensenellaceae bacterium]|nr:pyridoxal phosphate-dependent aminotransferase [Christensenellaceae bacterium]
MSIFDTFTPRAGSGNSKWNIPEGAIPMHVADMDFDSPPEVCRAVADRAMSGIMGYQGFTDEYYEAVINWFNTRHGVSGITKDMFIVSPGIVTALTMSVQALTEPDDGVIVQSPVYFPFYSAVDGNGRKTVHNDLIKTENGYRIDFDDLEKKAADASMLLLCSPHNPVGRVWTEEELNRLFKICKKNSLYIVSDEIHCDFILEGKHHSMLEVAKGYDRLVVCTAPSKTFNIAGLSNSNIIVPDKETRDKLQKVYRRDSIGGHNPLSMAATIAAYKYCAGWVDELNHYLKGNRDYAVERLSEHGIDAIRIEGTYLLWVDLSRYSDQPAALLKEHGLIVNEGSTFGDNGKGFVRFNLGCPREGLKKALDRLFEILDGID